ncbi:hypothetical protein AABC73_01620 [Pseudomonas sp. G.S.17]|jgi:hypothetical protein|uniref:hypothetical protein n=1 Tax=Pseudomonas sp. G.S.17 TaxID=3137451 RepID=UPI00311CABD4
MSFYMITYGMTQIEELFVGETEENTVANARELIDQWPEYAELSDEEIVELAKSGQMEFDLVEIHAPWPIDDTNRSHLIALYEQQYS